MSRSIPSDRQSGTALRLGLDIEPASPLWKRAPTRDESGKPVSDFMMLIPGLKSWSPDRQQQALADMARILQAYGDKVLFAECNLKLNLLWVSVQAIPGLCLEIPAALHHVVPQAKLVSQRFEP